MTMQSLGFHGRSKGIETVNVLVIDTVDSVANRTRIGQPAADEISANIELTLRKVVSRAGGQTVKGTGDGVLAIFPSASSAVEAACSAMQQILGDDDTVALRAGIAVGDIALLGDDLQGLAVAEAARLESEADRNGILCTAAVFTLARGQTKCEFRPGPELPLKGISAPVPTYAVDWSASPRVANYELSIPGNLEAELRSSFPFSGRNAAMKILGTPRPGASPNLTIITGRAGIGKTRLLAEWAATIRHDGVFILYLRGDAGAAGSHNELTPVLRDLLDSPAHARLHASSSEYGRACEMLADALSESPRSGTSASHTSVDAVFVDLIRQLGLDSPTVFIVDNLHLISTTVLQIFSKVLTEPALGVQLVGAYTTGLATDEILVQESELAARFPISEHVAPFELEPLDGDGVVEWLEHQAMVTLGKPEATPLDEIGRDIASAFFEASGGVPNVLGLVIRDSYEREQLVTMDEQGRWRAHTDIETLRRSQSAERLVRERLERLSREARELIEVSAVVGPALDTDLLRRITGHSLDELGALLDVARERLFIRQVDGLEQFDTEATQRAAYGVLPLDRRAELHRAVADALRERATDAGILSPDIQIARHLSAVANVRGGQHSREAARHFLRGAKRAAVAEPLDAVKLAHEALAVLDKFELEDDGQLRDEAAQVLALAQEQLGHSGSELTRAIADDLRGRPR